MAQSKRHYIDGEFGQIHLRIAEPVSPTQPPLLCLHMMPQSGRNFERFVVEASVNRTVVAPDFPGYGESDRPASPITAEDYARSVWQVVDSLGLLDGFGTVDLFGIHAGAKLATEVAHQRPDDVGRLVLSSAAVLEDKEVTALRSAFAPVKIDDKGSRFRHIWSMLTQSKGPGVSLEMQATVFSEILRAGEHYEWGHYAVFDYNERFPDVIAALEQPVTLLNPKDELYEMTPRTLPLLRNGQLIDRPDWGHGYLDVFANDVAVLVDEVLR